MSEATNVTYGEMILWNIIKKARIFELLDKLGLEHNAENIERFISAYIETPNTLKKYWEQKQTE